MNFSSSPGWKKNPVASEKPKLIPEKGNTEIRKRPEEFLHSCSTFYFATKQNVL
jgi:hypothetical protein